jgi:Large polyvalent protein associated domain 38
MATYQFQGPDGHTYAFDAPPGLSPRQVELIKGGFFPAPAAPEPPPPEPQGEPGFIPSVIRGGRGIASLFGDVLPAMGAKALGFDEYAKQQMQEAAEYQKETQRLYPAEVPSFTDIKGLGSALTYIKEAIGEAIPSMIPSIFTGGAAGIASRGAVEAAKKAAQVAAIDFAEKELVKKGGQAALTQEALAPIAADALKVGQEAAKRVALKYEAAGALAGSAAQNIPEVYQNLYDKGKGELPDLAPALISGGFNAVLDAITPINLLRKARISGIPEKEIIGAWYKRAGRGAVEGLLTEGGTESLQEMSSAAAESFVDQNSKFFTPENFVRFIDAGLKGGFGGAGITAAANVAFGKKEEPAKPETETTTETETAPALVDINSKEFKKKQSDYEKYTGKIAELEALGDTLTPAQKSILTRYRNRIAALKTEINDALAQHAAQEVENTAGTQPAGTGERFEILEQPGGGGLENLPAGVGGTGTPAEVPPSGGGGLEDLPAGVGTGTPAGVPPSGEGGKPSSLTPVVQTQAPVVPTQTPVVPTQTPVVPTQTPVVPTQTPIVQTQAPVVQTQAPVVQAQIEAAKYVEQVAKGLKPTVQKVNQLIKALGLVRPQPGDHYTERGMNVIRAHLLKDVKVIGAEETQHISELSDKELRKNAPLESPVYTPTKEQKRLYEETRQLHNKQIEDERKTTYDKTYKEVLERELASGSDQTTAASVADKLAEEEVAGFNTQKLPSYNSLLTDPYAIEIYFKNHILKNTQDEHDKAVQALIAYRQANKDDKSSGAIRAKNDYETQRAAHSKMMHYVFPEWEDLSPESQAIYKKTVANFSAIEQALAFRNIQRQIGRELADQNTEEFRRRVEQEQQRQRLLEESRVEKTQPVGRGHQLPDEQIPLVANGNIKSLLDYLSKYAKGLKDKKTSPVSAQIFRSLAKALSNIPDFKVNVVYDTSLQPPFLARYNADTNTIHLSTRFKAGNVDEATMLHELVHAATVKIIHQYFTDKSKLAAHAIEAVEHLQNIAVVAKSRLGQRYPSAFENLYEFVAYAMTDLNFQNALMQEQVPSLAKFTQVVSTLWNVLTDAIANLYSLFNPNAKYEKTIFSKLKFRKPTFERAAEEQEEEIPAEEEFSDEGIDDKDRGTSTIPTLVDDYSAKQNIAAFYSKTINKEPGYRGNLLLEATEAFGQILAAPEGGIKDLAGVEGGGKTLFAKAAPVTKTAPPLAADSSTMSDEDFKAAVLGQIRLKEAGGKEFLKTLLSQRGYDWFVQKFQNERQAVKKISDRAQKFGIIKRSGEGINDVWGQITRSTGMASDLYATHIKPLADEVHSAVEAYAKKKGISVADALKNIHLILEARHEPERRHIKFLLNVPLDNQQKLSPQELENALKYLSNPAEEVFPKGLHYTIKGFTDVNGKPMSKTAEAWREYILEQLSRSDLAPDEKTREYRVKQLRALLELIVANKNMHEKLKVTKTDAKGRTKETPVYPDMFDENSAEYKVIADRTPAEIDRIKKLFDTKADEAEINAITDILYRKSKDGKLPGLFEETQRLNREANYWSTPVQNVVDFYGYKNYVPFKGKPGDPDQVLNLDSRRIGGELQEMENTFEGRVSEADNPLLQTLAEGAQAAMRAGRKDLTLAIKNAIIDKLIDGQVLKDKIQFADRYVKGQTKQELGGPNRIFHYNDDGSIDVLEIKNKNQLEAIRRSQRTSSPIIDIINSLTSGIGQTHTRYNPAFAPMNFVRDSLTNAFTLGAELGPVRAGRLIKVISSEVASGGLFRSLKFTSLYNQGKFPEINRLAGGTTAYASLTEEQRYYRDLLDYVKLGGKVSYLQGVAAKGALDKLMKEVGRSGVLKTKDQIDKFFDIYNETFELAARVGAFRMLRDEFRSNGESPEEAQVHAVEYAKNLANFEQVGQWGKTAGALFMFFRPAATGAVRAIDALRPAFGFNEKDFRAGAEQEGRTPEQIDRAVKIMNKERDSARAMAAGLAGMGVAMYAIAMMMSGDDDQKRNRVATDDMARWTRYARIFIPGFENPLQLPWGFGMGAFAAAGAQIASLVSGRVSFADVMANIAVIGLDSFMPLPFSRISPIDNFPAFALDSVTPSAARPFFEYVMNLDGLGREIYNNRQTRYGDAYTGGDSIPEIYKSAARMIFKATNGAVDWSPNTMYFFANNYMDGATKALGTSYNLGLWLSGTKDFDWKNDTLLANSFIGSKSNIDAREFSKAEKYIQDVGKRVNALKDKPQMYAEFAKNNPEKLQLVQMYNNQVNGMLRQLRTFANKVRTTEGMEPRERKAQLDQIIRMENVVKRQILDGFDIATHYRP